MAKPDVVKQHVEQTEYSKEKARLLAAGLLADVPVHELLADPVEYVHDLVAALLIGLDETLDDALDQAAQYASDLGLAELDPSELDQIKEAVRQQFISDAVDNLTDRVQNIADSINSMLEDGVSEDTVQRTMEDDSGRAALLAGLSALLTSSAADLISEAQRDVLDEATDQYIQDAEDQQEEEDQQSSTQQEDTNAEPVPVDEEEFTWVTVGDDKVCEGGVHNACDPRDGMTLTLAEWDDLGRPGSENLTCTIYSRTGSSPCRCVLEPAGSEAGGGPINVADAVRAGKDRARAEASA